MTYKLNPEIRKIISPVIIRINGNERVYLNGEAVADTCFDKPYSVASIAARDGTVVLDLEENKSVNDLSWSDGPESFF